MCIFIPFTIHGILLKASTSNNPSIVHGMSTCLQALEHLSERYDDVEFLFNLHQATLNFTHSITLRQIPECDQQIESFVAVGARPFSSASKKSGTIPPLTNTNTYAQVLRLHNQIISGGNLDLIKNDWNGDYVCL